MSATAPAEAAGERAAPRQVGAIVALVLLGVLILSGVGWRLTGGDWAVIRTPSMGTAAPVGTLVVTHARPVADVKVGDIISYRSSVGKHDLYTHRVVSRYDDGSLEVRGDLNGASDPFPVTQSEMKGVVVAHMVGVGFALRALPFATPAVLLLLLGIGRWVAPRWRAPARLLAVCGVISGISLFIRPWVNPVPVTSVPMPDGNAQLGVVSAGLLPTRVTGIDGHHIDLVAGQAGVVMSGPAENPGVAAAMHLTGLWLVAGLVVCALPVLWLCLTWHPDATASQSTALDTATASDETRPEVPARLVRGRTRFPALSAALVTGGLGAVLLASVAHPALAGFTAAVKNSNDTSGAGSVVMQQSTIREYPTVCTSTDGGSLATNSSTCSSINMYGSGDARLNPGESVSYGIVIKNTGTLTAKTLTLTPVGCTQSGDITARAATDLCNKVMVTIDQMVGTGAVTVPISPTTTSMATLAAGGPMSLAAPVAPGASVSINTTVTLPVGTSTAYSGLYAEQKLTWTFGA